MPNRLSCFGSHLVRTTKSTQHRFGPVFFSVQRRDVSQSSHVAIPEEILNQLDRKKPLENSVNLYARHFALSTGQYRDSFYNADDRYNWPSTTKEDIKYAPDGVSSAPFRFSKFVVDWAACLKPNKSVMYTKSSHHSNFPCLHIYPDNVKVTFTSANPSLEQIQRFQEQWMSAAEPAPLDFINVQSISTNSVHIYVCCHAERDVRCGFIGELLISRLRKYIASPPVDLVDILQDKEVEVFGCSHVGGHKYAGNMVIYRPDWKQGVWYGRVLLDDLDAIIRETILRGNIIEKHWRGGLPSGNWDPKEKISAKEASERSLEWQDEKCACHG